MNTKIKILHLSPDFNYSCGVSKQLYLLVEYFNNKNEYELHIITNGGDSLERLKSLKNVKVSILKFHKGIRNILNIFQNYLFIKKYCIKNKIHIIHSHHRYLEFVASILAKKLNIKTITSAFSIVSKFKIISFRSDLIIAPSKEVVKLLTEKYKVNKNKIKYLPHCVSFFPKINDIDQQQLKETLKINETEFVFLFVGRLHKDKGYDVLLAAFKKLQLKISKIKLIMIGAKEDELVEYNLKLKINNLIYLEPSVDYYKYYFISDVVVLPSRIDPYPLVMLEAGICSKPFIGGKTPGISELIIDNENGLLCKPGDVEDLMAKMEWAYNNRKAMGDFGNKLNKIVISKNNIDKYFSEIELTYKSILHATAT